MAKRALLVGINRYKIPGADLRGCVNDVKNLRSVLSRYYGFAYNLAAAINARKGKLSYKELYALTLQSLKKGRFDQVPQLEGHSSSFDLPFLSSVAQAAPPRILVASGTP